VQKSAKPAGYRMAGRGARTFSDSNYGEIWQWWSELYQRDYHDSELRRIHLKWKLLGRQA
jgi:hypothetical protein